MTGSVVSSASTRARCDVAACKTGALFPIHALTWGLSVVSLALLFT
jgi:hypothetical protein